MSLRPRHHSDTATELAYARMAPGGRRWSESPVPPLARRRVRAVGSIVGPGDFGGTVHQVFDGYPEYTHTYFDASVKFSSLWPDNPTDPPLEGDLCVVFLASFGQGAYAPTGWTTHGEGSVGVVDFCSASLVVGADPSAEDWQFGMDLAAGWYNTTPLRQFQVIAQSWRFRGWSGTLTGSVSTSASTVTAGMNLAGGAAWNTWVGGRLGGLSESWWVTTDPVFSWSPVDTAWMISGNLSGDLVDPVQQAATLTFWDRLETTTYAADWVLPAWGLIA